MRLPPDQVSVGGGHSLAELSDLPRRILEELRRDLRGGLAVAGQQIEKHSLVEHRRPRRFDLVRRRRTHQGRRHGRVTLGDRPRAPDVRLGCRSPGDPARQDYRQFGGLDGLGEVVVHAGRQARVAVFRHRVRREGHDRHGVVEHRRA